MLSKPLYKLGKRLGAGIHEKCQTQKFALSEARAKKTFKRRRMMSDFGRQLIEKQKVRFAYGITEKQLVSYIKNAIKTTIPIDTIHILLETRLDNTVYKLGLAPTRRSARQMVVHGHITLNGRKVTIPSAVVKEGDVVAARSGSREKQLFMLIAEKLSKHTPPKWLILDAKKVSGKVSAQPKFTQTDSMFDYRAVFEFYSR